MSVRDFSNIEVGDTVIVHQRIGRSLHVVAKVTRTQITIETGTRFIRNGGHEYGTSDSWYSSWASIPMGNDIAIVKAEQRQCQAIDDLRRLENQIQTARLEIIRDQDRHGWAASIEAANRHMRQALEALAFKQESLEAQP